MARPIPEIHYQPGHGRFAGRITERFGFFADSGFDDLLHGSNLPRRQFSSKRQEAAESAGTRSPGCRRTSFSRTSSSPELPTGVLAGLGAAEHHYRAANLITVATLV